MSDAKDPGEVRVVVIPTGVLDVLLPNAAVAEVTAFHDPVPLGTTPDWLLGIVTWRGCEVPLVTLAQPGAETLESIHGQRLRLIICYTPNGNATLPYVGILAYGPPRLARLSAQALAPAKIHTGPPFVLHGLTYEERPGFIPDMDAIEQALLEAMQS